MTTVHLLHAGYAADRVGSLHRPRPRRRRARSWSTRAWSPVASLILDPLREHGVAPGGRDPRLPVSHHHPDHTINIALFPNAEVVDFWARYHDDLWLDHDGDGYRPRPEQRSCG